MTNQSELSVEREWDPLREAIVGRPFTRIGASMPKLTHNYMPAESVGMAEQMMATHAGSTLAEALPPLHDVAVDQMTAAIDILTSRGVVVHQVEELLPDEEAFLAPLSDRNATQYFPRDPVIVVGDAFIETGMRFPMRRSERFAIRRTLAGILPAASLVSMPEPPPQPEGVDGGFGPGPFLEGGDVMLFGDDILVGVSGNASNAAGIEWLQGRVGAQRRVHPVRVSSRFLHLDCILATPREGLAIVCREGFVDGIPDLLRDWDLIDVPAAEAEAKLAVNVLVLDESTTIVAEETPEVADALAAAGQDVVTTPFAGVFLFGGAFRCWHHPLRRG